MPPDPAPKERRRAPNRPQRGGRRITDRVADFPPAAYITIPALASHLNVQPALVRKWIKAGTLPASRFEGLWRIRRDDAIQFVEKARFRVDDDDDEPAPPSPGSDVTPAD